MSEKNENFRFVKLLNGNCCSAVNKLSKSRHENFYNLLYLTHWMFNNSLLLQKSIKGHEYASSTRLQGHTRFFVWLIFSKLHTHTVHKEKMQNHLTLHGEFTVKILDRMSHLLTYFCRYEQFFLCYFARIYLHTWQLKNIVLY